MDMVEINPGLEKIDPDAQMHGDDPDMKPTTETIKLGIDLTLSALGKTILHDYSGVSPGNRNKNSGGGPKSML